MLLLRALILIPYLLIQSYLYKRAKSFVSSLFDSKYKRYLVGALKGFFVVINLPLLLYLPPLRSIPAMAAISRPFLIWASGSLLSFLILLLLDALCFVRDQLSKRLKPAMSANLQGRRKFLKVASGVVITAPVAAFVYGAGNTSQKGFKIEPSDIPIKDLPESLSGLRICQLSDIHVESFVDPGDLEHAVRIVNELDPDLVFLTGDFLTHQEEMVSPLVEIFSKLTARHGVYGCLGNHEIYTHTEDDLSEQFNRNGIEILRQQIRDLTIRGDVLRLVGIDYVGRYVKPRVSKLLRESATRHPTILLSHQPNIFPEAAEAGIDLTLSGHTHGGQIMLKVGDFELAPSQVISPYVAGHYKLDNSHLYVNRGLGTVGPPVRLNAPPEITLIKLTSA